MNTLLGIVPVVVPILFVICAFWLFYNIYMQKRIEVKLERLMKAHEKEFFKMLIEYKKHKGVNSEVKQDEISDELLMRYFRDQIMLLDNYEKTMMSKVVERKKATDQIRYASKLYEESGLNLFSTLGKRKHAIH